MGGRIVDAFGEATFDRHRRGPGAADRGAGDRAGARRAHRRDLGRAAPHPRGDGRAAGLRRLHLAGGAHLQAFGDDSARVISPGAVPAGARGLGHRLQDGRQDRPGGRHRPRRARAAAGRGLARAWGRRPTRATPCCRRPTWSSRRRPCSSVSGRTDRRGDDGPRSGPASWSRRP